MASRMYMSLSQPPTNLKESIDWMIRVYGLGGQIAKRDKNGTDDLGPVVEKLVNYDIIKKTVGLDIVLKGLMEECFEKVGNVMGYTKTQARVQDNNGIASTSYISSYQKARWSRAEANAYASILLVVVPVITFVLLYLRWKCKNNWSAQSINSGELNVFLKRMGFEESNLNGEKRAADVAGLIDKHLPGLQGITLTYETVIGDLKREALQDPRVVTKNALAKCFHICHTYLTSNNVYSHDERCRVLSWLCNMQISLHFKEYPELDSMYSRFLNKITAVHSSPHKCPVFSRIAIPSLTVYPRTLKETIDWMVRIYGLGGQSGSRDYHNGPKELSNAVEGIVKYSQHKATIGLEVELQGIIDVLTKHLAHFLGFFGGSIGNNGIVTISYTSSYRDANWNGSDALECALIFLTVVPVITFVLSYLHMKCKAGWHSDNLRSGALKIFFTAMGFDEFELNNANNGSNVARLIDEQLTTMQVPSYNYEALVAHLRTKAQNGLRRVDTNPLAKCFHIIQQYLTTESPESAQTVSRVLNMLQNFNDVFSASAYSELNGAFRAFLQKIGDVVRTPTHDAGVVASGPKGGYSEPSSSVGSVAGGVIGTAAVGGAGAAVGLDLGGVKTMIKSAFDILR
ncbi:uncharacterized protein BcabD6B2_57570 [Babesia caballi]|uniref:Uncharacterized protein n=1 Tax=Babesia caballi TaxID=5871 RepID=A0AAV4M2M0_BABCB|nr:hypothetical protein, conserved [Babesia caballi]